MKVIMQGFLHSGGLVVRGLKWDMRSYLFAYVLL